MVGILVLLIIFSKFLTLADLKKTHMQKKIKQILSLLIVLFISNNLLAQKLPKKPELSDIRSYNQQNLLKITLGMSRDSVIDMMGGQKTIQTYYLIGLYGIKKQDQIVSNPYSRDLLKDKSNNNIEIIWYFTDIKKADGAITKDELTPIILENNKVTGIGWGYYEDYSKRKEINININ